MVFPMPTEAAALMDTQAELTILRWAAFHVMDSHDRAAGRLAVSNPDELLPTECPCSVCRQVRPYVGRGSEYVPVPEVSRGC